MLRRGLSTTTKINSLLIDGEGLLKQGYYGAKQFIGKNGRVGTIFHFINTIRRFYESYGITKVVVFWEGNNSKEYRKNYYPYYKLNRNDKYTSEDEKIDLERQRIRIKQYLEELFIRQVEIDGCEADDGIAYYVTQSPNENKLIFTNDRDLLQLLNNDVKVYLSDKKAVINTKNFNNYFKYHYKNVGLMKMIAGDSSDNISGVKGLGVESVLKLFPELKREEKNHEWVIENTKKLLEETPKSKQLLNIIGGETKWGTYGTDYFSVMEKIISLKLPNVTEDLKVAINEMVNDVLSPENRGGIKVVYKMMYEDELVRYMTNSSDYYVVFWTPFITIINKELKMYNQSIK